MHLAFDLISETGRPGGIRTYWSALVQRLARNHPEDHWTLVGARDLEIPPGILDPPNVHFLPLGRSAGSAMWRRLRQQLSAPGFLARHDFDAVHSVNNVLPLAATLPRVVSILDCTVRHTPERFPWQKRLFLTTLVPLSARAATEIVTISETTRDDLLDIDPALDPDKITVIPLGVEPCFHDRRDEGEARRVREKYRLPERFTLFVGALEPGKNIPGMLEALETLARRHETPPPLVIAGGGGWGGAEEALERARDLPVHRLGRVPDEDLPALYREASLLLFPSFWEGFGLPVLEAFASGVPVITSNLSALPEVAGPAACLVDPHDPGAIARTWERVWTDAGLQETLRRAGKRRTAHFSWDHLAERTYDVYVRMVGRGRARPNPKPVLEV